MNKTDWFYPTAYSAWGEEEEVAIYRVLRSGRLTMGDEVAAFEHEFAEWHGMKHAIMVNSGSSANLIAVAALFHDTGTDPCMQPLQRGDKVLVPAIAWPTTYAPLVQHGLDLQVLDVNHTWNVSRADTLDVDKGAIKLQIVCSILGNPANVWAEAPWAIIEDNCESLGAIDLHERKCGTRGLLNTFSLFWSHQLSVPEGGVILTNDPGYARLCRMLRAHGWTRDVWDTPPSAFELEYDFRLMGYNVRPLEMHAAIAREQLKKLPKVIAARQKNVYQFRLRALQEHLPVEFPIGNGQQSPFGIHFTLEDPGKRQTLAVALRQVGIDCRLPTGGSLRMHPYGQPWRNQPTPKADWIHVAGMFLGNGPLDLTPQIERAIQVMKVVLQ